MKRLVLIFASALLSVIAMAQAPSEPFTLHAGRLVQEINIDGHLDEPQWYEVPAAAEFTEFEPQPNTQSSQKTEVRILYADDAIYVGAWLFDTAPDSILAQMSERDRFDNTDYFGMWFSCFRDGINAFEFFVTPAGIQLDAQVSAFGEDAAWNAVWQCNTSIDDKGWYAEFKIPYSALRFPEAEEQIWDVNFTRVIRREREQSFWKPLDPLINGFINQSGVLKGIKDVKPPVRLFFYPYGSGYLEMRSSEGEVKYGTSYNGGMDVKLGLSKAFTLDMTLVPDFGQVVADNKVFNLSPFEVQFAENRPFFTEGTELFNKGGLLYTRRIGGFPINFSAPYNDLKPGETVVENPTESRLINATKISGRTAGGLGIGVFNAVSQQSSAIVEDSLGNTREVETSPLTNYNILVFDQNLKNNSYFTLINTNVMRNGAYYDANVLGTEFRVRDKGNVYELAGGGAWSKRFQSSLNNTDGFRGRILASKISGNWTYGVESAVIDDKFNPNDLGFLTRNNVVSHLLFGNYSMYQPKGKFNRLWSDLSISHNSLFSPNVFTHLNIWSGVGGFTRKFNAGGWWIDLTPTGTKDYFEPRVPFDQYYFIPESYYTGGWISTDYRKRFAYDVRASIGRIAEPGRWNYSLNFEPRFRVNDRLMLIYSYTWGYDFNDVGWVSFEDDQSILGRRDRHTQEHLLTANYVFTNRMGLSFRLRHYWSYADYNAFFGLDDQGRLTPNDYQAFNDDQTSIHDGSYNAFNIDMVYRWVFAPGSEINIVWKNIIEDLSDRLPDNYGDNLDRTLGLPQTNSFSIRVLYFIDYYDLRKGGNFIKN